MVLQHKTMPFYEYSLRTEADLEQNLGGGQCDKGTNELNTGRGQYDKDANNWPNWQIYSKKKSLKRKKRNEGARKNLEGGLWVYRCLQRVSVFKTDSKALINKAYFTFLSVTVETMALIHRKKPFFQQWFYTKIKYIYRSLIKLAS